VTGEVPLALVGIIANPAASKDIRRLVAQGRVIPDWEKVNIVRRVLLGLQAAGIDRVVAMPDSSRLCERARDEAQLTLDLTLLDMPAHYAEGDTIRAAALMGELGVDCLVTLGGDGTNRAVARGCCAIPLVAISTGTNNVFPVMVEGTVAGLAAGVVARGQVPLDRAAVVSKTVEIYVDGEFRDLALVDLAFSRERFVATRAIWDLSTLYEVFLTRAEPASIGLSAVGSRLEAVSLTDEGGLRYALGDYPAGETTAKGPAHEVIAPIAPGMVHRVPIASWERIPAELRHPLEQRHSTVALDGERAFTVTPEQQVEVVVRRNGPPVVQVEATLKLAAELGVFRV
jgi:hypothetical protein